MPKLRDAIMRSRTKSSLGGDPMDIITERDGLGNLSIWHEGLQDMDPYQAGTQREPQTFGPADETKPPIFITDIPRGGIDPAVEQLPGSARERAEMDAKAAEAGVDVIDLSKNEVGKTKPPPWISPEVDLNAPGERGKFKAILREKAFQGVDLPDMDYYAEAAKVWNPTVFPEEFEKTARNLAAKIKSARDLEDRAMAEYDKNAAIQLSMRKRKLDAKKLSDKEQKDNLTLYNKLGQDYLRTNSTIQLLRKSLNEQFDEAAKPGIQAQIDDATAILDDIMAQRKTLESTIKPEAAPGIGAETYGRPAAATPQSAGSIQNIGPIAEKYNVPPEQVARDRADILRIGKEADDRGLSGQQKREYVKQQMQARSVAAAPAATQRPQMGQPAMMPGVGPGPQPSAQQFGPRPEQSLEQPSGQPAGSSGFSLGPLNIDIDGMKKLAEKVGLGAENWKAAAKLAADAAGVTVDMLLYKRPIAEIEQLLKKAVAAQAESRNQLMTHGFRPSGLTGVK